MYPDVPPTIETSLAAVPVEEGSEDAALPSAGTEGAVLIVEAMYDPQPPAADPLGEWFIVRNVGISVVRMRGWRIHDSQAETLLPDTDLPPDGLMLVAAGGGGDHLPSGGIKVLLPGRIGNGLRNSGDSLTLLDGTGVQIDAVSWGDDEHAFAPAVPLPDPGVSIHRYGVVDTDTAADWLDPNVSSLPAPEQPTVATVPSLPIGSSDTPSAVGATILPSTESKIAVPAPAVPEADAHVVAETNGRAGEIELSEVALDAGWVEVYNKGTAPVDLRGWSILNGEEGRATLSGSMSMIPAHGFAIFAFPAQGRPGGEQQLLLQDVAGSLIDHAQIGPVGRNLSWSRYPVHGGGWQANTPRTPGTFNLPSPPKPAPTPAPQFVSAPRGVTSASVTPPVWFPYFDLRLMAGIILLLTGLSVAILGRRR